LLGRGSAPANHDRFGHEDPFGWRNLHNARSVATLGLSRNFTLGFMYDNFRLAGLKDAVCNGSGQLTAGAVSGTVGQHVRQDADIYGACTYKHFTFGAGCGCFSPDSAFEKPRLAPGPTAFTCSKPIRSGASDAHLAGSMGPAALSGRIRRGLRGLDRPRRVAAPRACAIGNYAGGKSPLTNSRRPV
jgi:hypothetical protein